MSYVLTINGKEVLESEMWSSIHDKILSVMTEAKETRNCIRDFEFMWEQEPRKQFLKYEWIKFGFTVVKINENTRIRHKRPT